MRQNSLMSRLRQLAREFRSADSGNIAITFALATLPVIGGVGAAVDYSHANSVKAAMQAALDSTALMLSKEAANETSAQLNENALKYFQALFTRPEAKNITIAATYSSAGGSQVVVDGSVDVPTNFMGMMGYNKITVKGTATAKWGSERLRVALALDTTGSMASAGKMTALKSATKSLLNQLKAAAGVNGDVYVSIIPFSKDVNVGRSNYNANWIDWEDWDDDNGHDTSTTTCTTTKTGKSGKTTKKCTTTTTWVPDNHNTWNGCVTDRDQSWDQKVDVPTSTSTTYPSKLWPAEQYDQCPAEMMGLTYNWTALNGLVDQMSPAGSTNQPIGLVWAWQSLVGGGPLVAPAKDPSYTYKDVIVLMSDGLNTQNRWDGVGYAVSPQVDARMYDPSNGSGTCANIKAAGITIYTVHVNTDGDPKSTLLQNCASSSDKFWMVTSASDLGTVFNTIGTNLTKLRVAK